MSLRTCPRTPLDYPRTDNPLPFRGGCPDVRRGKGELVFLGIHCSPEALDTAINTGVPGDIHCRRLVVATCPSRSAAR